MEPTRNGASRGPTLIASVRRALRLMEAVAAHACGAPAKQLAREAGLSQATAYHLLRTLAHEGYVVRAPDGAWTLGGQVGALHGHARTQAVLARVRPVLEALRDRIGAAAYLAVHRDGEVRVLHVADAPTTPRADLGAPFDTAAHATALGKCVLRQLGAADRAEHLDRHPPAALTPHTVTDPHRLFRELEAGGLVFDRQEYALGTACAAVPVTAEGLVGALGVSFRPARLPAVAASAEAGLRRDAARLGRALALG